MINEDYHESILLFNATSKTKNGRKLEYDYSYKIPRNRDGVFEDFKELIYEHLFEVIRLLPLDHNCNGNLINKSVTCDAITAIIVEEELVLKHIYQFEIEYWMLSRQNIK